MAHLGFSRTGQKFDFQGKLVKACDLLDPALLLQRPQGCCRPPAQPAFLPQTGSLSPGQKRG